MSQTSENRNSGTTTAPVPFDLTASMQKGRVGEDIVSLGFRMLGFEVYRTGIEHTPLKIGYEMAGPEDADFRLQSLRWTHLFRQMSRLPDFILIKDGEPFWIEVKFRGTPVEDDGNRFVDYLANRYLGFPKNKSAAGRVERKLQIYWPMYRDIYLILLEPNKARMAKLDHLLTRYIYDKSPNKSRMVVKLDVPISGPHPDWPDAWKKDNNFRNKFAPFQEWYGKTLQGNALQEWMESLDYGDIVEEDDSIPEHDE